MFDIEEHILYELMDVQNISHQSMLPTIYYITVAEHTRNGKLLNKADHVFVQ